jgi:transposase
MIEQEKRKAIYLLIQEGMSVREIARRLRVGRNAIRKIHREGAEAPTLIRKEKIQIDPELLQRLHNECDGFKQRILEKLVEEHKIHVAYSTLTRILRKLGIGHTPEPRCDREPDVPGAEMQHDTSPYVLKVGGHEIPVIGSSIYLRYCKRRYLRFYPRFDRFRMKCFLHEAVMYWGFVAPICIIDNTNLARLRGSGANAVIVPEMESFGKERGFNFVCHEIGHANRSAGEERSFWTVETNFFPGRTFRDIDDLNAQAFDWATVRMYHRPLTKSRIISAVAFEHERAYLKPVPSHLPAPYRVYDRGTDQYGYVAFGANYYWVPGKGRHDVKLIEYAARLKIYQDRDLLVEYGLPPGGTRNACFRPEGEARPRYEPAHRKRPTLEEEKHLRALDPAVGTYLDSEWTPKGAGRHRFLRELFRLSGRMTPALFVRTIERALKYRIDNLETIWRIALMHVQDGLNTLPAVDLDASFTEREAYQEGCMSDEPDFSRYDDPSEDEDHG